MGRILATAVLLGALGCAQAPAAPPTTAESAVKPCACGGDGCACIRPICGGTRACACAGRGTDCACSKKICRSAGVNYCCSGSHADGRLQRCNGHCGCQHPKGSCACSASCGCGRR